MDNQTPEKAEIRSISVVLQSFRDELAARSENSPASVAVDDILSALHERGFGVVLLFLSLPMALPFPVPPVFNVMLALPLLFLTVQQIFAVHNVWLPNYVRIKMVDTASVISVIDGVIPFLTKLELLTRPRLALLTGANAQRLTGVFGTIMALSVSVPLPLTNTVPSLSIAVMALGVLMRDGVAVLGGAVIGMLWVTMLVCAIIFFGPEGIELIKGAIKSLL